MNRSIDLTSAPALEERDLGKAAPPPRSRIRSKREKHQVKPQKHALVEGDVLANLDGVLDQDILEQSEVQPMRRYNAVLGARRLWQFLGLRGWPRVSSTGPV